MADTLPVAQGFERGFMSDTPRDELPRGAAYRMVDYLPGVDAPLRRRGGWEYATTNLNSVQAVNSARGLAWTPFAGDPHLVVVGDLGQVYQVKTFDGTGGTFLGFTGLAGVTHRPFWHLDRMILPAGINPTPSTPYKITKSGAVYTLGVVGGTPPKARVGCSWGDYLLLANYYDPSDADTLKNYRIAWSAVGNPDSWTLSGASASTFDMDSEVLAVMQLRNITMVWGYSNVWILTGDTPPPGGNLRRQSFLAYGTFDGRSVAKYKESAIWASDSGVYKSDGATLTDLTAKGGISLYYRDLLEEFSFEQGWVACGDVLHGHYILSILNSSGEEVTTLVCDIEKQRWVTFSNFPAAMYASRVSGPGTATEFGHEELFFAHRNTPYVAVFGDVLHPQSGSPATEDDGDGTPIIPSLETGYYRIDSLGEKRIRRAYLSYDVRSGGSNPTLRLDRILSPEETAYTALAPAFAHTTGVERKAAEVRRKAKGIAFRVTQTAPSLDTRLYGIEIEGHELEQSR